MKELFKSNRYDILLLLLIAGFPLYKYAVSSVLTILLLVVSIIFYIQRRQYHSEIVIPYHQKVKYFFLSVSFYLLMVMSMLYTSNVSYGLLFLQHGLYLFVYPLVVIFFVGRITKRQFYLICFAFVISCSLFLIYLHIKFYQAGLYTNFKPAQVNDLPFRQVIMDLKYGAAHPTYASMWFFFSALFILVHFLENARQLPTISGIIHLVVFVFLVLSAVLLSSKVAVLAFFFSLIVLFFLYVKNRLLILFLFTSLTILFAYAIKDISFLRARFVDEVKITEFKPPVGIRTNSLNIRVGIYECSWEVIKANWLVGTGVGDTQDELNKCYARFDTDEYKTTTYNTHNNYLDIAISTGLPGILSFIFMLAFFIIDSLRKGNKLFVIFIILVMICMIGENILSRNHGVIFYSLFSSLFIIQNLNER